MITAHTVETAYSTLYLEFHGDGWWHIAEQKYAADTVTPTNVIDWYVEGFDTARNTLALLTAYPSEVG